MDVAHNNPMRGSRTFFSALFLTDSERCADGARAHMALSGLRGAQRIPRVAMLRAAHRDDMDYSHTASAQSRMLLLPRFRECADLLNTPEDGSVLTSRC